MMQMKQFTTMHKTKEKTRLILIEGLPGAGKSTTCKRLGSHVREQAIGCRWYLENDALHPIDCTNFKVKDLPHKLPPLWASFVAQSLQEDVLTIIESRLWQNTALFMFMSDNPTGEIVALHRRVWQALAPLSPALIYLFQDDVEIAMNRLYTTRDKNLVDKDIQFTSQYPWFRSRGLSSLDGWVQFFSEWQHVAQLLYEDWPYRKRRIENPHDDWDLAYQQMHNFLKIG